MKIIFAVCLILAASLLQGCNGTLKFGQRTAPKRYPKDSWYKAVPPDLRAWDWNEIGVADIHEVLEKTQSKSQRMLLKQEVMELSASQFQALTGKPVADSSAQSKRPYLVRAVYFHRKAPGFSVHYDGARIWVHHDSVGTYRPPMKRRALVVLLNSRPQEVFVTCSIYS